MKKRIISLVIALNMIINLSGCANKNKNDNSKDKITWGYEDTLADNSAKESTEPIDQDIRDAFLSIINSVETPYGFDDYYPSIDTINGYKSLAETSVDSADDDTDFTQLLDIIEENTIRKYGKINGIFIIPTEKYTDEELARLLEINPIFKIAIKTAINNIFNNATNDITEDISKLKSISIIEGDLSKLDEDYRILGLWENEELTITIDYDALVDDLELANAYRKESGKTEIDITAYLTKTIEHEINHARQYAYENRLQQGQKYESVSLFENPSFFIESSAESELYASKNLNNLLDEKSNDYTYIRERDYETLILLLAVFKSNNLEGYYNAIFDSDLNAFWNYFKLETPEELKRFYSILYSMDTLCGRTDLAIKISDGQSQISIGKLKKA